MEISKENSILIVCIDTFGNAKEDDKIYITKNKIYFVPSKENMNSQWVKNINSVEDIFMYIHLLGRLLINDRDPFEGVQFFIPGFPSIMLDVTDLNSPLIRNVLTEVLTYWYEINGKT
jgi:hypothetical protein